MKLKDFIFALVALPIFLGASVEVSAQVIRALENVLISAPDAPLGEEDLKVTDLDDPRLIKRGSEGAVCVSIDGRPYPVMDKRGPAGPVIELAADLDRKDGVDGGMVKRTYACAKASAPALYLINVDKGSIVTLRFLYKTRDKARTTRGVRSVYKRVKTRYCTTVGGGSDRTLGADDCYRSKRAAAKATARY